MTASRSKYVITNILSMAGITVGGSSPYDIAVHDESFYSRVLFGGTLALGEAYMEGVWDCPALDQFFDRVLRADLGRRVVNWRTVMHSALARVCNLEPRRRAFEVGRKHYDIGNDLYERMLGRTMAYTCGYWKDVSVLNEAQDAKLDLVCKKIGLVKGDTVLDIGCGWGSWMKYAADKYGAVPTGITVSKEQAALGEKLCAGLPVKFILKDYREMGNTEAYNHVVSIGMFEHVGHKNYRTFFEIAHRALSSDGLFLLHTIGSNVSVYDTDPWIKKYIFQNGHIPSLSQISGASEGLFVTEDLHNFGADYDRTLMAWYDNFEKAWPDLSDSYSERFRRMWRYYLLSCAGAFRARHLQLWQFVFSKKGVPGGYRSVR